MIDIQAIGAAFALLTFYSLSREGYVVAD